MKESKYSAVLIANFLINEFAESKKPIPNLLLQKMLYYLDAYFMVNKNEPLFKENIEKWGYGPVIPDVYHKFKAFGRGPILGTQPSFSFRDGVISVDLSSVDYSNIKSDYKNIIEEISNKIYEKFHKNPFDLVNITHKEPMWKEDESNINDGVLGIDYSNQEIKNYFENNEHWPWGK